MTGGSFTVRITEVSTLKLRFSMDIPMADAIHYMPERNLLLVQVATGDGLVGLGECAAYGGSLDSMERVVLDDLQPSLIGEDPFHVERLWSRMARRSHQRGTTGMLMQAISGVDIALWDLIGQATRTPLYRLFGGYRDSLEAYASAGFYAGGKGLAELAEEVGGYAERGFRTVKMKVGRNPEVMLNPLPDMWAPDYATVSLDEDVERVRAARAAIGPDVRLAIDANNAWTPSVAIQFMRRVADQNIYWLEEPVATRRPGRQRGGRALARRAGGRLRDGDGSRQFSGPHRPARGRHRPTRCDLDRGHYRLPQGGGPGPGLWLAGRSPCLLVGRGGNGQHALHRLAAEWRLARVRPEPQRPPLGAVRGSDRGWVRRLRAIAGAARTWRITESSDRGSIPYTVTQRLAVWPSGRLRTMEEVS
jgi:L-alanine-DL-glutamate epimerase-like enolase superfamily enzyme